MSKLDAEGSGPALITDHPYTPPANPNRHLCAYESGRVKPEGLPEYPVLCNMGMAAHATVAGEASVKVPESKEKQRDTSEAVTRAGGHSDVPDGSSDAGEGSRWPSVTSPFGEAEGTGDDGGR